MTFRVVQKGTHRMVLPIPTGKVMKSENGFAYIALLASLTILMLVITAASENTAQNAKRERELQLFFVGEQFRNAIASYYENSPQENKQYPLSLENLLVDKRAIKTLHHLRKIYQDPITNSYDWGVVRNEQHRIIGIYSLSVEPVLITNFDPELIMVEMNISRLVYSDLKFVYMPTNP